MVIHDSTNTMRKYGYSINRNEFCVTGKYVDYVSDDISIEIKTIVRILNFVAEGRTNYYFGTILSESFWENLDNVH